jgi:hypothetical protein
VRRPPLLTETNRTGRSVGSIEDDMHQSKTVGRRARSLCFIAIALASSIFVRAQSPPSATLTEDTLEAVLEYLSRNPTAAMKSLPALVPHSPSFSRSAFSDTTYRIGFRLGAMAVENVRLVLTVRRGTRQFTIREEPPGPLKMAPVPQGESRITVGEAARSALVAEGKVGRQTSGVRQAWWWTPSGLRHAFIVTTATGTPPRDEMAHIVIDAYTGEVLK